ncbi:MAG: MFS transporter [Gammaproteobacteria bacterium RIFCSPHIGHO2_12_FULL_37_14]|nr:MAG: MFS transporter [Gammaproteobacteria bacterium RIFCSPHIGHO2_12_FULL_37_14]
MKNHKAVTTIAAWCLYDWASSSFAIIVTTFIFATYFTTKVASNHIVGTYQWANATALAGIIIAIISPMFGAIADRGGHHKRWLFFFSWICIISATLLWFSYPNQRSVYFTLTFVVIGTIGSEVALVFYNTFLMVLAPKPYMGRISGWGWGCGYLGGIFALLITLLVFVKNNVFSLDTHTAAQIRICGPFVGLWYAIFSLPLFFLVPDISTTSRPLLQAIRAGWIELISTLKKIPQEKNIFLFLLAHMIYTDGLNTLFAFGGIYAAGTYGLSFEEVLIFGITMNITAGIGAISFAWIDDYFSSKSTVIISLICLIIFGIPILFLHEKYIFWGVALVLCLFVGPVQSASRSLMAHLISDKQISTELFGLYSLSGRITAFMGPWLLGLMTVLFNSQRVGMATIMVFFVLGMILLLPVRVFDSQKV